MIALAATFAAFQLSPRHQSDSLASSIASLSMPALAAGSSGTQASGALPLTSNSAAVSTTKPGHPSASPAPSPAAKVKAAPPPPPCVANGVGGTGMLPYNYATIVDYLATHGYTKIAATGIAGNIYQESRGDPESVGTGGGGLIGWTPLPAGYVTGNPASDLQTQLAALLTYNQQWAQYIPALNAAPSPAGAADVYMNDFERPGIPAAFNREGAAAAVARACGIG